MKFLNIKNALEAWQNLLPLYEKDKEKVALLLKETMEKVFKTFDG